MQKVKCLWVLSCLGMYSFSPHQPHPASSQWHPENLPEGGQAETFHRDAGDTSLWSRSQISGRPSGELSAGVSTERPQMADGSGCRAMGAALDVRGGGSGFEDSRARKWHAFLSVQGSLSNEVRITSSQLEGIS